MVKIDQHGAQLTVEERVADGLTVPGKLRLESTHFDHQSQQRGDHFFARDYQHVAQRQNPCNERMHGDRQLMDLRATGAYGIPLRYSCEQMSTLSFLVERAAELFSRTHVSPLSEATIEELREALIEQLKHQDSPTPRLAKLLRKVGSEAKEKRLKPEELLVVFKQLWNTLSESGHTDQYERVRQQLVTLCIQAYYAE